MTDSTDRLYERVLVLRCQTGDETAFAELVDRYQPRLRYYLRKMLRAPHQGETADSAVDDTLQEVWLDVFRAIPRLADAEAFRAWLYRIARDRAFRTFRHRPPPHRPLDEAALPDTAAGEPRFTEEDAQRIHAALDELAAEHREVVVLRYIEEMSYDEIAGVVGCPVGTVRSRLHYARQVLGRRLERRNVHD